MKKTFTSRLFWVFIALSSLFVSCDNNGNNEGVNLSGDGDEIVYTIPKVYITTPDNVEITSKENWLKGGNIQIYDKLGNLSLDMEADFRGRGNTTWTMPKKPYAIKLSSKSEVLGMPKHKRWVLLANWMDRTLLRNDVAFEVSRVCMEYTPRGEFVELYMNGEHRGSYYLCEQIKVDKNRVNIDEIDEDTPEEDLTGGYLLEFDTYSNAEINYFYTQYKNYPVTVKEPDEDVITSWEHPGFVYIQDYVNGVEEAFENKDYEKIEELLDLESYANWWLVYNLVGNFEPAHPKSCYMYKKRDGKLYAGPAWDFDWGTFRPGVKGAILKNALWYGYLFEYDKFREIVKEKWNMYRSEFEKIPAYIDKQANYIKSSNEVNLEMWPITQEANGDIDLSFDESVARMKDAYIERINELDNAIKAF